MSAALNRITQKKLFLFCHELDADLGVFWPTTYWEFGLYKGKGIGR